MTIIVCIWSTSNQLVYIAKIDSRRAWQKVHFGTPTFFSYRTILFTWYTPKRIINSWRLFGYHNVYYGIHLLQYFFDTFLIRSRWLQHSAHFFVWDYKKIWIAHNNEKLLSYLQWLSCWGEFWSNSCTYQKSSLWHANLPPLWSYQTVISPPQSPCYYYRHHRHFQMVAPSFFSNQVKVVHPFHNRD